MTVDSTTKVTNLNADLLDDTNGGAGGITILDVYPIGSIYISTVSTNPGTLFGAGTWAAFGAGRCLFGVGTSDQTFAAAATGGASTVTLDTTMIPSHNHTQNAHNHTQNSHNHTQDSHNHTQNSHNHTQDSHNHTQDSHLHSISKMWGNWSGDSRINGTSGFYASAPATSNTNGTVATNQATTATNQATTPTNQATTATNQATTATNNEATATNNATGGGGSHNNLPPYVVVYMWQRTA